jgi:predicted DNA-binding transcriptional regulator YafY
MFTERQNLLLSLLREQGRTTGDALAATLAVSKRTVYRDLGALIEAGFPIRTEGGPGGGIWLDEPVQASTILTEPEPTVAEIEPVSRAEDGDYRAFPAHTDSVDAEITTFAFDESDILEDASPVAEPEDSPEESGLHEVAEQTPAVDPVSHWFDQAFGRQQVEVLAVTTQTVPVDDDVPLPTSASARQSQIAPVAEGAPPVAVNLAAAVRERIFLDASGWWQEEMPSQVVVDLLQEAIFTNRMMRVQFHATASSDTFAGLGATTRVIEPYGLVAKAGVWYLVSRQGTHFVADRLSRVASAEQLSGRFERATGFDLETWWSRTGDQFARGNEQYRFTALVRRNRVEFLRMYVGGRVQVDNVDAQWARARLEVASPEAAVMIVLGLGQDAVVIEPDELPLLVRRAAAGRPLYEATTPHRPTPSYALG